MSLTITQREQRAIVETLESIDYDVLEATVRKDHSNWDDAKVQQRCAELGAKAAIEAFLEVRDQRDQWCVISSNAGVLSAVGPYPTINKVKEAVDGGKVTIADYAYIGKLRSHDVAEAHIAEVDAPHPRVAAADEAAKGRRA